MDRRIRQKGTHYDQEVSKKRPHCEKPSLGSSELAVPSWERNFCSSVNSVEWSKIVNMKKNIHHFDKILKWDDSGAEESFHNAKDRYYAIINNLPCDIPLPDPNMFIEEVVWDTEIEPELILDLEGEPMVSDPDERINESIVIIGNADGDGDGEHYLGHQETMWDHNVCPSNVNVEVGGQGDFGNYWGCWYPNSGMGMGYSEWGDAWNSNGWGVYGWDNNYYWGWNPYGNNYGTWDENNGWGEGMDTDMPRHNTSTFQGEDLLRWANLVSEQPTTDTTQWNTMHPHASVRHNASWDEIGNNEVGRNQFPRF